MTLAVKETTETNSPKVFDRLAMDCFKGTAYVLASIWVVFYGISHLWVDVLKFGTTPVSVSLMVVAMVAAAGGLIALGTRLAGPQVRPGLKTGVVFGILSILTIAGLTSLVGILLERTLAAQPIVGIPITAVFGAGLLYLLVRMYSKPGCESTLVTVEEQGWFQTEAYKKTQGVRVRRGTMLALLILAGCGIYTMLIHQTLVTGPRNWEIPIPYTGKATVIRPGDTGLRADQVVSAAEVEAVNKELLETKVRVTNPGDSNFQLNEVKPREEFEKVDAQLKEQKKLQPTKSEPIVAEVKSYPRITLLPDVMYTLPIILALSALWLSYRVVNYPTFADFLIATEAELNKVSWTTRRRLVQDTIVVLVTVFLLTTFLFLVDLLWSQVLSSKAIGVLKVPDETDKAKEEEVPW